MIKYIAFYTLVMVIGLSQPQIRYPVIDFMVSRLPTVKKIGETEK